MASKNQKALGDIGVGLDDRSKARRSSGTRFLAERENQLSRVIQGELEDKVHRWVDPDICRIWEHHNRNYDLLNEENCADLISGFKAQKRQEMPAIVRKVSGDSQYQYEVICGARRHWTTIWLRANNYPEFRFLIEVRELTDEQAFRLSDIENRDRQDLSDYERAQDYKRALKLYYNTQKQMAERLLLSEDWLSRMLDLADMPREIVEAYDSIHDIRIGQYRQIKPLLKHKTQRERILRVAEDLKREQLKRKQSRKASLPGPDVVKILCAAAAAKQTKKNTAEQWQEYKGRSGGVVLKALKSNRSGCVIRITASKDIDDSEIVETFRDALTELRRN